METQITHQNYIPFQFHQFHKDDKFIDCVLEIEDGQTIKTHRVLLAKYSKWFYQYFKDHPIYNKEILTIKLETNPENVMQDVITFFYTGHLHLTVSNIVSFMHCSHFYQIPIIEEITSNTFNDMLNEKNALFFARRLIECNLTAKFENIAPIISNQIRNIVNGQPSLISKQDIFKSLNPMLFHKVLMQNSIAKLDDFVKAALIDEFIGDETNISEDDKQFLASAIDWGMPDSNGPGKDAYKILVNFKCNWIPSNISRPLYIYAINVRRNNLNSLENEVNQSERENYSRWFLYPWVDSIKSSKLCNLNPKLNVIDFISRLGFRKSKVDSTTYGFFSVNSSKPISSMFQSKYAFMDHGYFLTQMPDKEMPFISINFGPHSHLLADQIKIRCHPIADDDIDLRKNKKPAKKKHLSNFNERPPPYPFSIIAQSPFTEQETLASSVMYNEVEKEGDFKKIGIKPNNPLENLTIVQDTNSPYGNNVLRIYQIELHGQFLP